MAITLQEVWQALAELVIRAEKAEAMSKKLEEDYLALKKHHTEQIRENDELKKKLYPKDEEA